MAFNREIENLIADLRGEDIPYRPTKTTYIPEYASIHPKRRGLYERKTQGLESLLEKMRDDYKIGVASIEEIIMRNWKSIFGTDRAHRCAPERVINNEVLVVFVSNATLRNELQFDKRRLLKKLNAIEGCQNIRDIQFRQG